MDRKGRRLRTLRATLIVFSLIVSLLGISCQNFSTDDRQQTARERDGLYGPVRTMEVIRATLVKKDGEWEIEQERPVQSASYDRQGRKIEQRMYAEDGSLKHVLRFTYNDHSHATQTLRYNIQDQLIGRTTFTYNAAGHLVESHTYTITVQNETQTLVGRETFTYDETGHERTVQQYDAAGTLLRGIDSIYDEQGRLVQKKWHNAQDVVVRALERHNDYQGTLVSEKIYTYASDGTVTKRVDIQYNTHGEPQEQIEYREAGRFKREQRFTYQADAFGNWTIQTMTTRVVHGQSPSFEPPVVVSRTFTYFDKGSR